MIEVMANKRLAQLNLPTTGGFEERLSRLKEGLKDSGVFLPEKLLSRLHRVRGKVIDDGSEPTTEELNQSFGILDVCLRKLS